MNADEIKKGRALVKAIAGLLALEDAGVEIAAVEVDDRTHLLNLYRRELRRMFGELSVDALASLLSSGPQEQQVDICLN